jgi:Choline/Carnitine o-acyltransferase
MFSSNGHCNTDTCHTACTVLCVLWQLQIESAAFVLCLDSCSPVTRDEVARELWHGDGTNRWYDKSVQIVVFANGKAGMMVSTSNTI